MTVYPPYMQRHELQRQAEKNRVIADRIAVAISVLALVGIVWAMLVFFVDAAVLTVENEEKYNKRTWTVEQTYSRPAAFRLATPTPEQMDQLHAMLTINQVQHPERIVTNDE